MQITDCMVAYSYYADDEMTFFYASVSLLAFTSLINGLAAASFFFPAIDGLDFGEPTPDQRHRDKLSLLDRKEYSRLISPIAAFTIGALSLGPSMQGEPRQLAARHSAPLHPRPLSPLRSPGISPPFVPPRPLYRLAHHTTQSATHDRPTCHHSHASVQTFPLCCLSVCLPWPPLGHCLGHCLAFPLASPRVSPRRLPSHLAAVHDVVVRGRESLPMRSMRFGAAISEATTQLYLQVAALVTNGIRLAWSRDPIKFVSLFFSLFSILHAFTLSWTSKLAPAGHRVHQATFSSVLVKLSIIAFVLADVLLRGLAFAVPGDSFGTGFMIVCIGLFYLAMLYANVADKKCDQWTGKDFATAALQLVAPYAENCKSGSFLLYDAVASTVMCAPSRRIWPPATAPAATAMSPQRRSPTCLPRTRTAQMSPSPSPHTVPSLVSAAAPPSPPSASRLRRRGRMSTPSSA